MSSATSTLTATPALHAGREAVLARRVRLLVTATISYNLIEAVVALSAGAAASSGALIGFGLDSVIEVTSAAAVAWQFSARDSQRRQRRERRALRVIALSFFALAGYVTVDAVRALAGGSPAGHSTVGLVLAALSLLLMPVLSGAQRRAGRELGSLSAVADSKQTLLCTYLSAVLLVGLGVNSLWGWSWADSVAALVIAVIAGREGWQAWHGDGCCAPALPQRLSPVQSDAGCCAAPAVVVNHQGAGTSLPVVGTGPGQVAAPDGCCATSSACGCTAAVSSAGTAR